MLDGVANVLNRIQQISKKFTEIAGVSGDGSPSFHQTLDEAIEETKSAPFSELIDTYSEKYGIDPKLINSIIKAESNFNPNAVSKAGASGLMQLMPETAKALGITNIFAPDENIEGGIKYFKTLLDEFNQNLPLALAAYNAGPEVVKKTNNIPQIDETKNYVEKVLNFYKETK
ncbi:MAG: lytic transglycosylase domain-containing protein [bacterium]